MAFSPFGITQYNDVDERYRKVYNLMQTSYATGVSMNQTFWYGADQAFRMYVGDQTIWNELYANSTPSNNNFQFSFNLIRPVINMISGHERKTRKSIVAIPIENADNETADQFSKVMMWCINQEDALMTISEAFEGALVGGMNLVQVWLDYRSDPISGNMKFKNCQYNEFLIDPFFRQKDLSDCNYVWKRSYITKKEALSLMPDKADEILSLSDDGSGNGVDGLFQYAPEAYNFTPKGLLSYDEYYYRDYREQDILVDTITGETMEWKHDDKEGLEAFMAQYPEVQLLKTTVPTVRLAIAIQDIIFFDGPNPLGIDTYSFVPVVAYYAPQLPYLNFRLQGVVKGLMDAQYLYNRSRILELKVKESQVSSGWKYKEDALVNPMDVFLSGEGRGIAIKRQAAMSDVEKIQPADIPPAWAEQTKSLGEEIHRISGVNDELMGSAIDDKPGVLSFLRQRAGLTTLQVLFDNLDSSKMLIGKIMIDVIQANFAPGKIKKILEGQEPTQQFYNKAFGKYHAAVEEGLNTSSQREAQFLQMIELRNMGVPIGAADLLEAATLQNKERVIKNIEAAEKAQAEMQQKKDEMAMQVQMAEIELAKARAEADRSLGADRMSNVEANRAMAVERVHKANAEDEAAFLDKVKAIKELETIDLQHLATLLQMSSMLKQQESLTAETSVGKVSQALGGQQV